MRDLAHLHLSGWPFRTTAHESFGGIWADRVALLNDVKRLFHRWARLDRSTFHLMWADLGAGKTHTLHHIQWMCRNETSSTFLPLYSIMPRYIRSFLEVYQAIIGALDLPSVAALIAPSLDSDSNRKRVTREMFPSFEDAVSVLHVLGIGSEPQRAVATDWFRGVRGLTRRQLDSISVTRQIRTSDDAVAVLSGLTPLVRSMNRYERIILMLDECQRLGNFKIAIGRDISAGLQTWLDATPNHLTLIMSFGSGEEKYVRHFLSPELFSRADHQRLRLDLLTEADALRFIQDLFQHFRIPGDVPQYFPLAEGTVMSVIGFLARRGGITPRELMNVFDALLSDADYALSLGEPLGLSPDDAVERAKGIISELPSEEPADE